MARIEEVFAAGFCKALNQTRSLLCVVVREDGGDVRIEESDCDYGVCPHSGQCVLMQSVRKGEGAAF